MGDHLAQPESKLFSNPPIDFFKWNATAHFDVPYSLTEVIQMSLLLQSLQRTAMSFLIDQVVDFFVRSSSSGTSCG